MRLTVDSAVAAHVIAGTLLVDGVHVAARDPRMDAPMAATAEAMRRACEAGGTVAAVRAMYRRFGVDPTKTRPSSEALLRRVRKGEGLPRVNAAVDVCNWCSLEAQLPFGLYDTDRISGDVTLRVGRDGEAYEGIRKDRVHLAGRLTLADADGPFGNPTSDSARTMVDTSTRCLWLVIFTPRTLGAGVAAAALTLTSLRLLEFCGGREVAREVT